MSGIGATRAPKRSTAFRIFDVLSGLGTAALGFLAMCDSAGWLGVRLTPFLSDMLTGGIGFAVIIYGLGYALGTYTIHPKRKDDRRSR